MVNEYYQKKTMKSFKKKHVKGTKIFLKKKKKKSRKRLEKDIKIFLKNKKKKTPVSSRTKNLSEEEKQKKFNI